MKRGLAFASVLLAGLVVHAEADDKSVEEVLTAKGLSTLYRILKTAEQKEAQCLRAVGSQKFCRCIGTTLLSMDFVQYVTLLAKTDEEVDKLFSRGQEDCRYRVQVPRSLPQVSGGQHSVSRARAEPIAKSCWKPGMTTLEIDVRDLEARKVELTRTELVVTFADGRKIATPLEWYPRLKAASAKERANFEIMPLGIHWPDLDEDLSIAGMLRGQRG